MLNLKVIQCNEKETEPGNFIVKLQTKELVETFFGTKEKSLTYYVKSSVAFDVNSTLEVPMEQFRVQEHEMLNPATGDKFMGKWLHAV
jgi:hypothetical protein